MKALLQFACVAALLFMAAGCEGAELDSPVNASSPPVAAAPPNAIPWEQSANALFGLTNLWTMHLTIQPDDWNAMEPPMNRGGRGARGGADIQFLQQGGRAMQQRGGDVVVWDLQPGDTVRRGVEPVRVPLDGPIPPGARGVARGPVMGGGGRNQQFTFAPGLFEFEGKTFGKVAVRFKGNSSFASSRGVLKRSFKIDFNDYVKGQRFFGMTKLSLNCNAMDPSQIKEAISYAVFQRAGVPSARTAFAKVYLTVPGKYDRQYLGLYTLIEQVDERFLQDRFGTREGLLLKPEGAGGLRYSGENWESYIGSYDPQTTGTPAEQKRFIEFTKFLQDADANRFRTQITSYLDVDQFLRHLAVTVVLANMDSILGMHHNFYLYLNPKSHKVQCFPWDLNLSLGSMGQGGPNNNANLSIMRPAPNSSNSPNSPGLIPRLLAIEEFENMYRKHMQSILATAFKPATVHADIDAVVEAVREAVAREERIVIAEASNAGRPLSQVGSPVAQRDSLKRWITTRAESVAAQLAGTSEGWVPENRGGGRGGPVGMGEAAAMSGILAQRMFQAGDANQDGNVSRDEFVGLAANWFRQWDSARQGKLDQSQLAAGLNLIVTMPAGLPPEMQARGRPPMEMMADLPPGRALAASMMSAADMDKDARLTQKELAGTLATWFDSWRTGNKQYLNQTEIRNGLQNTLGGAPTGRVIQ